MRRFFAIVSMMAAAIGASACSGPGSPLGYERAVGASAPIRKPLLQPGESGALPPPSAVFEKARSADPSDRAAARAELMRARASAGLGSRSERVSFLDLPDGVAFASLGAVAFAAPPIAGVEDRAASQIRAGFLDALGGAAPRERAYLADSRFLVLGRAATRGETISLSLRLYDAEGADAGRVEAQGGRAEASRWLALGRRAAEKVLASPRVARALRSSSRRGFASPGPAAASGRSDGLATATTSRPAPQEVSIVAVAGAPGNGGAALETAMTAALQARGLRSIRSDNARYRISARVTIRRHGSKDRAEIRWLFTERGAAGETVIGEATQARSLPRGGFDRAWGPLAVEAANAAADAFASLLKPPG